MRRTDLSPLPQIAVAHTQFETIHPFNDGNGRTGRALVHLMLKHLGATTRTTLPISAGLLSNTNSYYRALTAYRQGDANPIVLSFAEATFAAIANGRQLAAELAAIVHGWQARLTVRRDSVVWRLLPILIVQPVVTSAFVQETCQVSQPAADRALRHLSDHGILTSRSEHDQHRRRNLVWRTYEVLEALGNFSQRSRRR